MSFLKAAFWIAVILLLLPTNGQERFTLYATAQRTIADIGGFCTRNPDVCENVSASFRGLLGKLKSTTDSIEDMLQETGIGVKRPPADDQYSAYEASSPYRRAGLRTATTSSVPSDTLTAEDKRPRWHGPDRNR